MRVSLDPRTKLLLLVLCALAVFFSPGLWFEVLLLVLIVGYGCLLGHPRLSLGMLAVYAVAMGCAHAVAAAHLGTVGVMMSAFFQLVRKVFPCGLLAALIVVSTPVNEFMSAMNRMRWPRALTVPLAVMLRYVPAIREDWAFITDAMRMRGVSPSLGSFLRHPGRTIECLYVPLMMSASHVADELSAAAIARGIENPQPRTCYQPIAFGVADVVAALLGCAVLASAVGFAIHG